MSEQLIEAEGLAAAGLQLEQAIKARKDEIVIAGGFSDEDSEGNEVPDYTALKQAGAVVLAGAIVTNRDDRAKVGISSGDLYAKVLPDAPGADGSEPTDYMDEQVKAQLVRFLWGITQVSPTGYVQKQLTDGRMLVRATVHRGHDPVLVAYVTDDVELLMTDSLQPEIDALVKRANKLHVHAEMIVTRQPALTSRVTKAITTGTRRASTDARLELTAGDEA